MKKKTLFDNAQGAAGAGFLNPETGTLPVERQVEALMTSPTADDAVLKMLVWHYESTAEKEGRDAALNAFWGKVDALFREGVLTQDERETLMLAGVAGIQADILSNPKYIKAVQELVKANPEVLRLPFIQSAVIGVLKAQKYGPGPLAMRDVWSGFLHTRPKKKNLHSRESLRRLVRESGVKPVDAHAVCGEKLGIGEDTLKKLTREKGRGVGRLKKGR